MIAFCALASLFILASEAGRIKICAIGREANVITKLKGATVKCYDEDSIGKADYMTGGTTGSDGCVVMKYGDKKPKFGKLCNGWDWCANNPDIYCVVKKNLYYEVYTKTETNFSQDKMYSKTVTMFINRVARGDPGNANGCGPSDMAKFGRDVADALSGFQNQCKNHDLCYESCKETQKTCDDEFGAMMYSKCNDSWDHKTVELCYAKAGSLYTAVREFGADAFAGSRDNCDRRRMIDNGLVAEESIGGSLGGKALADRLESQM